MTLTGDNIDAERAYDLGLVNQVVPADQVLEAGVAMAERIARNGPLALQATKELVRPSVTDPKKAIERQAEWQPKVFSSADAKEGATALIEQRDPQWQGRSLVSSGRRTGGVRQRASPSRVAGRWRCRRRQVLAPVILPFLLGPR